MSLVLMLPCREGIAMLSDSLAKFQTLDGNTVTASGRGKIRNFGHFGFSVNGCEFSVGTSGGPDFNASLFTETFWTERRCSLTEESAAMFAEAFRAYLGVCRPKRSNLFNSDQIGRA